MTHSHLKFGLMISAASLLWACSDTGSVSPTETVQQATLQTSQKGSSEKTMDYLNEPGKTDKDHLYLEEVLGDKALEEVRGWNKRSLARLESDPLFEKMQGEALTILNSKEKIPFISYRAGKAHNFWQDATHVRGLWRTTSLESYLGDDTQWETILDMDKLAKDEEANWVYSGNTCLAPDFTRCILNLSDGGKDAVTRREFNTQTKQFVKDGFVTPESKGAVNWIDEDHLIIGVDFGTGTMTDSGYPMVAKLWSRGTPIESAKEIMRGDVADVAVWPGNLELEDGRNEILITRSVTFYESEYYWVPREGENAFTPVKVPVPAKANLAGQFKGQVLVTLQEDWRNFEKGALVSFGLEDFMQDGEIEDVHLVYAPDAHSSIGNFGVTKSKLLMSIYKDVSGSAHEFDWDGKNWSSEKLDFPANGSVSIGATNDKEDIAFISTESFLTPDTLWTYDTSDGAKSAAKGLPSWFDADSMTSKQYFSTSKDGTKVPYFVVHKKDMKLDGSNPTLLFGYGGFEISLNPSYSATRGKLWIERGGVYVLANIRGGGEYGPKWHQAGLKTKRQVIYDDFISVAEDLIAKDITTSEHLGIEGGSNGGLLMGAMFTQRPDLFNAVICAVPLLDMLRYHTLLAGASWMGEYGDPDDAVEGAYLRSLSPYHNIKPDEDYPEMFLITSTKDDRVHPAHARKMAKRLEDLGHDFLYYENIDGGHSAAANLKETARRLSLQHTYLFQKLGNAQ